MSSINLHTREINVKVVYYGPGLGGKTSSLQHIHRAMRPDLRGQLVSLATSIDRTLYFDFLPVKLPKVKGFTIRMSLYTVPGQVHYNATRKLVLQGCDGVVFVADSQPARREGNIESYRNLLDNLRGHGMNPHKVPLVFQFNKRDLPNVLSVSSMDGDLNDRKTKCFETCAVTGAGIFDTMRTITKLVLSDLKRKGIYQGAQPGRTIEAAKAPVVSAKIEAELVQTMEQKVDQKAPAGKKAAPASGRASPSLQTRGLTFSELFQPGSGRDQILAMEGEVERGDIKAAVKRAEGVLREYVGKTNGKTGPSMVEALLILGVHGAHYARFRTITSKGDVTKPDAMFCLFFLTDVELRIRAAGMQFQD